MIELMVPARAVGYADDGKSVWLSNGEKVAADVVILATGWQSSWTGVLDGEHQYQPLFRDHLADPLPRENCC